MWSNQNPLRGGLRSGLGAALGLLALVALAACGGQASAHTSPTATATTNAKGESGTPVVSPTASPPYSLPAAWTNAAGLPLLATANPNAYAFAPSDERIGYLCVGPHDGKLYVTHDGGVSWQAHPPSVFSTCDSVYIDAHDASDVFVETPPLDSTTGTSSGYALWRSRDGGATWRKLGAVTGTGLLLDWSRVAVVGSRLIGQVGIDQEGYLQNDLYVSYDGGATWKPFATGVANQGYTISSFTLLDSAIVISSAKGVGSAGLQTPIRPTEAGSQPVARLLTKPLSGQPPTPPTYWRSYDAGASWAQMTVPGSFLYVTPRADGQGSYTLSTSGVDIAPNNSQAPQYDARMWWSANSGATWQRLPDLAGIENGYVTAGGVGPLALGPDGSVITVGQHTAPSYGDDAGVFRIQPASAVPAWQPLAPGRTQVFAISSTSAGLRLWSIGAYEPDAYLKYLTLP